MTSVKNVRTLSMFCASYATVRSLVTTPTTERALRARRLSTIAVYGTGNGTHKIAAILLLPSFQAYRYLFRQDGCNRLAADPRSSVDGRTDGEEIAVVQSGAIVEYTPLLSFVRSRLF